MVGPIERVLVGLSDARVQYLVVGGVAVVLHGHLRTTADLDLVIRLEPDNVQRAVAVLSKLATGSLLFQRMNLATFPENGASDPKSLFNRGRVIESGHLNGCTFVQLRSDTGFTNRFSRVHSRKSAT